MWILLWSISNFAILSCTLALRFSLISQESRRVELGVDGINLLCCRVDVEDNHTVDAHLVQSDTGGVPLPGDVVAVVE